MRTDLAVGLHEQVGARASPAAGSFVAAGVGVATPGHLAEVVTLRVRSGEAPNRQHTSDGAPVWDAPGGVPICAG